MARDTIGPGTDIRRVVAFWSALFGGNIQVAHPPGEHDPKTLHLLAALQVYGTSGQLRKKYETLQAAAIVNRDLPMDEEDRKRIADTLNELGGYVMRLAVGAMKIEEELKKEGCRVNQETGRVSFKRGGRGPDLLREHIWSLYREKHRSAGNTFSVRRAIGKELAKFIDPAELDPKAGALIYDAIHKGEERKK